MTDRATLLALAERVEMAEGPDHRLDREIHLAIGLELPETIESRTVDGVPTTLVVKGEYVRRYLGDLNAAVALVPKGWAWSVDGEDVVATAFNRALGRSSVVHGEGARPSIALTAAALRARAAMGEEA